MLRLLQYLRQLNAAKQTLWCYLIWYLTMSVFYFDPAIHIWLTSLGISAVIGVALILSVSNGNHSRPDRWTIARLFMMPFCVSSFSALVKDHGFILILSPSSLSDLGDRSEASGKSRTVLRSFEENSGDYLTKMIVKIARFNAAAVDHS